MKIFRVYSNHDVYVDSYLEGELDNVNYYTLEDKIQAETPREAIEKYFENVLGYDFDFKSSLIDDEVEGGSMNRLYYDVLTDGMNYQATQTQKEEWKEGRFKLYVNNIIIYITEEVSVKII